MSRITSQHTPRKSLGLINGMIGKRSGVVFLQIRDILLCWGNRPKGQGNQRKPSTMPKLSIVKGVVEAGEELACWGCITTYRSAL